MSAWISQGCRRGSVRAVGMDQLLLIALTQRYSLPSSSRRALVACNSEWVTVECFAGRFGISVELVYLQRCSVVTWLVPREAVAVSAQVLCTSYNHAPVYSATSFKDT